MIRVLSVFGTRPEATKMCPLIKVLEENENIESKICVTAQHREQLDQVLKIFNINPDYDLDIMKDRQSLSDITVNAMMGLDKVIKDVKPDVILVHGDTTTTFVASLTAFYNKIKVAHVEAGLRTFIKYFPYPEEINRKLTDVISDIYFAPTENSKNNLLAEGVKEEHIYITGNTAIDALKYTVNKKFEFYTEELKQLDFNNKRIITVTAHRRENIGEPLENICKALKTIAEKYEDVIVVYAVHKNPAVREIVNTEFMGVSRVLLLEPLAIDEMHNLMDRSCLVVTDSGGLQEEVPSLSKPLLVLRKETERPEAIDFGTLRLVGVSEEMITKEIELFLNDGDEYNKMANSINPYGDGEASERTVQALLHFFGIISDRPKDFNPLEKI